MAVVADADVHGAENGRLGVVANGDDEGETELRHVGGVQFLELRALVIGERIETGARLFRRRGVGEALRLRELAGKIGVRDEHAQPFLLAWPCGTDCEARSAGPLAVSLAGRELAVERALGDPGGMLEDRAEMTDELRAVHLRRDEIGRLVGVVLLPVSGDIDAAGEPDLVLAADVVEELLEAGEAAGHADEPAVEPD